ncbi:MAG TPA: PEGA domain-containing protein, partial [Pyrinomonadaceae bacterium]|nr:PEGA domain-containing protein [Pyrinomonadaceae bacterium]
MKSNSALNQHARVLILGFAVIVAILCCLVCSTPVSEAKKPPKYGTIKVQTNPAGLPVEVDGKPEGQTSSDWRAWDLNPGVHTVVIILPNGQRWTREIILEAGRIKCVA